MSSLPNCQDPISKALQPILADMISRLDPDSPTSWNLYEAILECVEKPLIQLVLAKTKGNRLKAARMLGINRNTLHAKISKLGLAPNVR